MHIILVYHIFVVGHNKDVRLNSQYALCMASFHATVAGAALEVAGVSFA